VSLTWLIALPLFAGFTAQDPQDSAPLPEAVETAPSPSGEDDPRYEGALRGVRDGEDFNETAGYRRLLDVVSRYAPDELAGKVEAHLDMKAALADPATWRGRIVRVRGIVAGLTAERLASRLGGHVDVYRAFVWDGESATAVDFLETPPPLELERDLVEIEGVFFRTVAYTSRKDAVRVAPYVVGHSLRVLDPDGLARSTGFDTFAKFLCVLGGCLIVARLAWTLKKARRVPTRVLDNSIRERAARASRPLPHKS
jgi:hypothetical protein